MEIEKVLSIYSVVFCIVGIVNAVPTAQIDKSRITGKTVPFSDDKDVQQYLGVPYAEPPLGPLRFRKPQPIRNYPTEFEAITNPPACLQYTPQPYPWRNSASQSEDCLFLNIYTPSDASPLNQKAVMYWISDTFTMGDPFFDGSPLAALGDIIVVTVNYRVGYFGFLTSNDEEAPGNVGIWDILEGLRWVNKHIEAFGGDASRITIAGQSLGAVTVGLLSISPLAKGLYARQIMESSSPVSRRIDNNTQNLAFSQQLAKYVGCADDSLTIDAHSEEVVKCLRDVDAERLSKADYDLAPRMPYHLLPQFGDEILPSNPRESVINGDFSCTDLLIGSNKNEGTPSLTAFKYQDYFGFYGEKNPHVNRSFGADIIRTLTRFFPDPEVIVDHYIPPNLKDDTDYRIRKQTYTALGDLDLLCPTVYYADQCAGQEGNVYYYFFTHRPSNSPWAKWMGVAHFDEVQFVFGKPVSNPKGYTVSENELSQQVIEIWSNFVKSGKPGIDWPLYSKEDRAFHYIGPDTVTAKYGVNGPRGKNCKFLKPYFGF